MSTASQDMTGVKMLRIDDIVERAAETVARCNLGSPGSYRRWAEGGEPGVNPYGCADAANILYTIGRFPGEPEERAGWVAALRGLQDPTDGLYRESTHHPVHTTAHCVAALELFDARPERPLSGLHRYLAPDALHSYLGKLEWRSNPWRASHQGAGLYAALVVAGEASPDWEEAYFSWFAGQADPATGLWRRGQVAPVPHNGVATLMPHLAGTFHYLFNHEYARRPLPFPASLVDTCLAVRAEGAFPLARRVGFAEVDWVYCLNRALRQSHHRATACRAALEAFTEEYVGFLRTPEADEGLLDLHQCFGVLCALAELQAALPGMVRTAVPLRLVLDRRPFI
ncbi:hypothetical protein [Roseomonas elaeocarpi]|uniref:Prenyltransferase n=1 Tax=Roseomonas elaeocarpi TaxID=907779 RepID=A0ABV6JN63_9PROT